MSLARIFGHNQTNAPPEPGTRRVAAATLTQLCPLELVVMGKVNGQHRREAYDRQALRS